MTKYHVSPKTGKVAECGATVRPCRYANYNSIEEAAASIVDNGVTPQHIEGITKPAIILPKSSLIEPRVLSTSALSYEYDYDFYGDDGSGYYSLGEDDYYSTPEPYSVYDGLRLETVDAEGTVRGILGIRDRNAPLPDGLQTIVDENDWNDKYKWEISAENDYYGESVVVTPPENMLPKLQEWFWKQENASDVEGVLDYVRSKGTETKGLTPVDAIKKQLSEENEGRHNRRVENATKVSTAKVNFNRIIVPHQRRLNDIDARPATNYEGQEDFAGVLIKEGNRYRLADGYHRLKHFKGTTRKTGKYIILS